MKKGIKKVHALLTLGCIGVLTMAGCFDDEKKEQTKLHKHDKNPVSQVEEFWDLAKAFSEHKKSIFELNVPFSQLGPDEKKKLGEKSDGDYYLTHYLAQGRAAAETAQLLGDFLGALDPQTAIKHVQKKVDSKTALGLIRDSSKRHKLEEDKDRHHVAQVLLYYDNDQVNDNFEAVFFNGTMTKMEKARAKKIYSKLSDTSLNAWMTWAMNNKALAQAMYNDIYAEVGASNKAAMHNSLFASSYPSDLMSMLDASDPWGFVAHLETREFEIENPAALGTTIKGSLPYVITLLETNHSSMGDADALPRLRRYLQRIQALAGANFATLMTTNWPATSTDNAKDKLLTHLTPQNKHELNYWMGVETLKDVVDAAADTANVTNASLRKLYASIAKDDPTKIQALSSESPTVLGNARFLNLLVARAIDDDLKEIFDNFWSHLTPEQRKAQTKLNSPTMPLISLLGGRANLKGGDEDDINRKAIVFDLAKDAHDEVITGLTKDSLKDLVALLFTTKPAGKAPFALFHACLKKAAKHDEAQLMRDELLKLSYARNIDALDLITNSAAWSLDHADKFNLTNKAGTGVHGPSPLLEVLALRAAEEEAPEKHNDLRSYALAYKAILKDSYNADATVKAAAAHLAGRCPQPLIAYYLALKEDFATVFDAAAAAATGAMDWERVGILYAVVIGNRDDKAQLLAQYNKGAGDMFIHILVKHPGAHTGEMMRDILSRAADTKTLVGEKNAQHQNVFELLLAKPLLAGSEASYMLTRLLNYDNDLKAAAISPKALVNLAETCFTNNSRDLFKEIYAKVVESGKGASAQMMRSKLLDLVHKRGKAALLSFIGTDGKDPWGLQAGIHTDKYKLPQNPTVRVVAEHQGTFLEVLAARAIEDNAAGIATAFADLHEVSLAQKTIWEKSQPNTWNAYAKNVRARLAKALVKDIPDAKHKLHGYAEYALQLDEQAPQFDAELVMAAADSEAVENAVLKWLYQQVIRSPKDAEKLHKLKGVVVADSFIHRITAGKAGSKRQADEHLAWLLEDFLGNNFDLLARQVMILGDGEESKTSVIAKLLEQTDNEVYVQKMLVVLLTHGEEQTIKALPNGKSIEKMFAAVFAQGKKDELALLLEHLDARWVDSLTRFCATNMGKAIPHDPTATLGPIFAKELKKARWDGTRKAAYNGLLQRTYNKAWEDAGQEAPGVKAGLLAIQTLISQDFVSADDLAQKMFDPFKAGYDAYLPYAMYLKGHAGGLGKVASVQDVINGLSTTMKTKLGDIDAHKRVLETDNKGDHTSVLSLIATIAGSLDQAKGADWCAYE